MLLVNDGVARRRLLPLEPPSGGLARGIAPHPAPSRSFFPVSDPLHGPFRIRSLS